MSNSSIYMIFATNYYYEENILTPQKLTEDLNPECDT